jgi:hypothetical protein
MPLHGLRHTSASIALAKGVNAAIVSRRLGRATVAFTLDIYSHALPQVDAEAAEFIAAFARCQTQGSQGDEPRMPLESTATVSDDALQLRPSPQCPPDRGH